MRPSLVGIEEQLDRVVLPHGTVTATSLTAQLGCVAHGTAIPHVEVLLVIANLRKGLLCCKPTILYDSEAGDLGSERPVSSSRVVSGQVSGSHQRNRRGKGARRCQRQRQKVDAGGCTYERDGSMSHVRVIPPLISFASRGLKPPHGCLPSGPALQ